MRKKFSIILMNEAKAEKKKAKAAEMEKRKAEMWNRGVGEVLSVTATELSIWAKRSGAAVARGLPKWAQSFRYYKEKYNQNIVVMVGSTGFSVYCTYEYIFKNVGTKVKVLEANVKAMTVELKDVEKRTEVDRENWVSKKDFATYAKKVDKLQVEVASLIEARRRPISTKFLTITPISAQQAASLSDMRQNELRRHEWRKALGV